MNSLTKLKTKPWLRLLLRKQGLILRIFVCWGLAALVMLNDESYNFDTRFKIRGEQKASKDIVLLTLRPADLNRYYDVRTQNLLSLNELTAFTDSFFWDQNLWFELLQLILEQDPRSIGVSLYFGDQCFSKNSSADREEKAFVNFSSIRISTPKSARLSRQVDRFCK